MKCIKCGYDSEENTKKFGVSLCTVCIKFAPNDESSFKKYISEKADGDYLEPFRRYSKPSSNHKKEAMAKKAIHGNIMSRAPFGYEISEGKLIPAQNFKEIEEIFEEFLNNNISLSALSEKHKLSVNGLKKILKNFTYIGKIKFNNHIYEGSHQPLISTTLFNHVQNKIEKLGIK